MKELTKKVVILNNFSSPYISQAIIVLKDYNPKLDSRAIEDAELVVSRYIEQIQKKRQPIGTVRKNRKILKFIIGLALTALFCTALRFFR